MLCGTALCFQLAIVSELDRERSLRLPPSPLQPLPPGRSLTRGLTQLTRVTRLGELTLMDSFQFPHQPQSVSAESDQTQPQYR